MNDMKRRTRTATLIPVEDDESSDGLLQTGSDSLLGVGMVTSAVGASVVPTMGFGVARQQAMVGFIQGIRDGDCSGVSAADGAAFADSPTQMQIPSSSKYEARYLVGGVVGNFIFTLVLVGAAQICGMIYLKRTGSSSWNRPFSVFARCHVSMAFFVWTSMLFAPTMNFGLVVLALPVEGNMPSVVIKVLVGIFTLLMFVPVVYYTVWCLYLRERKEVYRKYNKNEKLLQQKPCHKRLLAYWFEGPGEWRMPMNTINNINNKNDNNRNQKKLKQQQKANIVITEKDMLGFDVATPLLDGYQGHAYWFGAVEFGVQFCLALAPFLAQLVGVDKSCVTQAVVLLVVLGAFLLLTLIFRPFQERALRIAVPIVTVFEILVIAIALYFKEDQPNWIVTLTLMIVSMQSAMSILTLVASLAPLAQQCIRLSRRLKMTKNNNSKNEKQNRNRNEMPSRLQVFSNPKNLRNLIMSSKRGREVERKNTLLLEKTKRSSSSRQASIKYANRPQQHEESSKQRKKPEREKDEDVKRKNPSSTLSRSDTRSSRNKDDNNKKSNKSSSPSPTATSHSSRKKSSSSRTTKNNDKREVSSSSRPSSSVFRKRNTDFVEL